MARAHTSPTTPSAAQQQYLKPAPRGHQQHSYTPSVLSVDRIPAVIPAFRTSAGKSCVPLSSPSSVCPAFGLDEKNSQTSPECAGRRPRLQLPIMTLVSSLLVLARCESATVRRRPAPLASVDAAVAPGIDRIRRRPPPTEPASVWRNGQRRRRRGGPERAERRGQR